MVGLYVAPLACLQIVLPIRHAKILTRLLFQLCRLSVDVLSEVADLAIEVAFQVSILAKEHGSVAQILAHCLMRMLFLAHHSAEQSFSFVLHGNERFTHHKSFGK